MARECASRQITSNTCLRQGKRKILSLSSHFLWNGSLKSAYVKDIVTEKFRVSINLDQYYIHCLNFYIFQKLPYYMLLYFQLKTLIHRQPFLILNILQDPQVHLFHYSEILFLQGHTIYMPDITSIKITLLSNTSMNFP